MARSPLIYGGDLTQMDPDTLALITNAEMIAIDQDSTGNREVFRRDGLVAWVADAPRSADKYVAVFNTRDPQPGADGVKVPVKWEELGLARPAANVRDLWMQHDLGAVDGGFAPEVPWHGAACFRVSPAASPGTASGK